ncbi:hypothetical protein RchiOBHm_Chr7g0180991 [Rosa chinensis]|uniref:Transmembrane protein n=1 Tax=Rosa chinensis TaxID=74649 RepID=A0A2P6P2J0_ROSCH|nr:hypothetical protein RchiOBHm_Chr7g0180991 [Rosa chinensis]
MAVGGGGLDGLIRVVVDGGCWAVWASFLLGWTGAGPVMGSVYLGFFYSSFLFCIALKGCSIP